MGRDAWSRLREVDDRRARRDHSQAHGADWLPSLAQAEDAQEAGEDVQDPEQPEPGPEVPEEPQVDPAELLEAVRAAEERDAGPPPPAMASIRED